MRFTSAMLQMMKISIGSHSHGRAMFQWTRPPCWFSTMPPSDSVSACITTHSSASSSGTSYETICAAPRMAPSSDHLLFEPQPPTMIPAIASDETAAAYSSPMLASISAAVFRPRSHGITTNASALPTRKITGPSQCSTLSASAGTMSSLSSSFRASGNDWKTPAGPHRAGPRRLWMYPATLRSP